MRLVDIAGGSAAFGKENVQKQEKARVNHHSPPGAQSRKMMKMLVALLSMLTVATSAPLEPKNAVAPAEDLNEALVKNLERRVAALKSGKVEAKEHCKHSSDCPPSFIVTGWCYKGVRKKQRSNPTSCAYFVCIRCARESLMLFACCTMFFLRVAGMHVKEEVAARRAAGVLSALSFDGGAAVLP